VWRIALKVDGDFGTWVGQVDAHSGEIRTFEDESKYARVKGGIYPIGNDQNCPEGCEQPGYPMPFANITIGATNTATNAMGTFNCTPGGSTATTTLNGTYVKVVDQCGAVSQAVTCNGDIDLGISGGSDCTVPEGASAGNTHAARSSFYHLNRIAEHARVWLPSRTWLSLRLTDNVNISSTCNAVWDGSAVNFFKSGGGCNNTGEIAAVFLHEWGHGLDQNDGGGFDSPSEAYGDITSLILSPSSAVANGTTTIGASSLSLARSAVSANTYSRLPPASARFVIHCLASPTDCIACACTCPTAAGWYTLKSLSSIPALTPVGKSLTIPPISYQRPGCVPASEPRPMST